MTPPFLPKLLFSGAVGSAVTTSLQALVSSGVSLDTILTGVLGAAFAILFRAHILHGNRLAAISATQDTMQLALAKLDEESRTVDKRDGDSRHLIKNDLQLTINAMEERLMVRFGENRAVLMSVEERLALRLAELQERVGRNEERSMRNEERLRQEHTRLRKDS